jgi:hypothetical protein
LPARWCHETQEAEVEELEYFLPTDPSLYGMLSLSLAIVGYVIVMLALFKLTKLIVKLMTHSTRPSAVKPKSALVVAVTTGAALAKDAVEPAEMSNQLPGPGPLQPVWWYHLVPWGLRYFINTSVVLGYFLAPRWRLMLMTPWKLQRFVDWSGQYGDEIAETLLLLPNPAAAEQVKKVADVRKAVIDHLRNLREATIRYEALAHLYERDATMARHREWVRAIER